MTDYVKSVNFAAKDDLPSGDTGKVVRGAEINTELNNIATAINSKSNIASPLLTGTLTLNSIALTSTFTELNILDGVTSTTAELNILDGVTSTTAELNILEGLTATTAELNALGTNGNGDRTVSTSEPTGGVDGDIWYQVSV